MDLEADVEPEVEFEGAVEEEAEAEAISFDFLVPLVFADASVDGASPVFKDLPDLLDAVTSPAFSIAEASFDFSVSTFSPEARSTAWQSEASVVPGYRVRT